MPADPLETLTRALSDRYRVERLLGSGGMATVYLARDLKHDRPVAIKVLRPELAAALGPERFLREIQIAARLNHPHILALHDSGEADGLLYYVMPHVEGESLQDRIAREKQLPVADAVRIAREVASALAYAHGQGFIHRDIKPGNILLSGGYALVADFGLARALTRAQSDNSITHSGLTIGTPTYMSPEQAGGESALDGRSDLYALGCVLYEMLVGDPPFSGSTPGAVLARHVAGRVMPIRALRPAVPGGVERAVLRALEKVPADRYQKAEEFDEALESGLQAAPGAWRPVWLGRATIGALGVVLAVGLGRQVLLGFRADAVPLDTARYAVLPFQMSGTGVPDLAVEQLVQDALARWDGIKLVDRFQLNDAFARRQGEPVSSRTALDIARNLEAGRYIRGEVSNLGNGTRIEAVLFDAERGRQLAQRAIRVPPNAGNLDSLFRVLVDGLLFGNGLTADRAEAAPGTRSLPARQAYVRGHAAITRWDLVAADTAFATALTRDPEYAQAALWLALSRMWAGRRAPSWQFAADLATAGKHRLSARDRLIAEASVLMSRSQFGPACALWRRLTVEEDGDFAVWYGLGTCLHRDLGVLRDPRTVSGWRFRSSRHQAQLAYRRAFGLLPSIHSGMRGGAFEEVRRLLITSPSVLQPGVAIAPDTGSFAAYPAWAGDTLLLVPFRRAEVQRSSRALRPSSAFEALTKQRQAFYDIASAWVAAYPAGPDALEALGIAMEMLGSAMAIDTVRKARRLAKDEETRVRIAITETWMRLRQALPADLPGLQLVRAMADSLLGPAALAEARLAGLLAPLALLVGRGNLAAQLSRRASDPRARVPAALAGDAVALLAYASLAAPADSLAALENRIEDGITRSMDARQQTSGRREWLGRPASMAFPSFRFKTLPLLAGQNDYLIDAQVAFTRGDYPAAKALLNSARTGDRIGLPPAEVMIDGLLPETELWSLMGEGEAAIAALDSTLLAQRLITPHLMADVSRAGMLIRAMAWRADIAASLDDSASARLWARPVTILWSGSDPYLSGILGRMAQLSAPSGPGR